MLTLRLGDRPHREEPRGHALAGHAASSDGKVYALCDRCLGIAFGETYVSRLVQHDQAYGDYVRAEAKLKRQRRKEARQRRRKLEVETQNREAQEDAGRTLETP